MMAYKRKDDTEGGEFSHPIPWQKIEAEGLDCDYALIFSKRKQMSYLSIWRRRWCTPQDCIDPCWSFRRRSKGPSVWKGLQHSKKAGDVWRHGFDVQVFWSDPFSLPVDSHSGKHSRRRHKSNRAHIQLCFNKQVRNHNHMCKRFRSSNAIRFCRRYKDGLDHMGEHRDDEKELDPACPIASVSLGAARDFIFRHRDARGRNCSRQIEPVKLELAHGSLLLMNPPTNTFWYHSLPVRKKSCSHALTSPSDAS
ncbi:Alpha-ketoglutarate-dependent dioxygenase alkB-like 2 [Oryzias melastigma]|uniref:Alpha-ketoglutarate-dependent dioxygenase alkB-like 2 n=1 Tax=Oryzias melastigma TaxID=30732 RepID=A0A834CC14_ORYME|nr:Alpha-ketoglutarate-dependent dioxygenase alkB-like 2 [Oryzias melastigma]